MNPMQAPNVGVGGEDHGNSQQEQNSAVKRLVSGPSVRFCYYCGKKLWGKHHKVLRSSEDGHCRVFHKQCAKLAKKEDPGFWGDR